jgi:hypothetical protein
LTEYYAYVINAVSWNIQIVFFNIHKNQIA